MIHKIIIPYVCSLITYPNKPIFVWQNGIIIAKAIVCTKNGIKTAKTDLNSPYDLIARGKWVSHEGDKIDELKITDFDIK